MITAKDLRELTILNTDGQNGFLAQAASGLTTCMVRWPDHLTGKRFLDFSDGSRLAREWLTYRKGYGKARRSRRAKDFKECGATTCLLPRPAERRAEQLEGLRAVLTTSPFRRIDA